MSAPKIVNDKRTLYVGACARAPRRPLVGGSHPTSPPGGLEESVTTEILHAAFLPFGEITDVNLVLDAATRARLPLKHVPRAPVADLVFSRCVQRSTAVSHSSSLRIGETPPTPSTT